MKHTWTYANVGGNTRVIIKNGKDIQHLAELDEKLWTVLACPTSGLEIPDESLQLMDANGDKKIQFYAEPIRDIKRNRALKMEKMLHKDHGAFAADYGITFKMEGGYEHFPVPYIPIELE